jgi:serine/threonine protein kinase
MEQIPESLWIERWIHSGDLILGKYRFLDQIAEGGIAAILRVQDVSGRDFVVKTIKQKIRKTDSSQELQKLSERLMYEGKVHSLFRHRNIISWVENGFDDVLGVVIVMEYAPYGNLQHRINERRFSPNQIFTIADSLLDALSAMHQPLGFVHLDVEPKNIVFAEGDIPKLCDFNYTRRIGEGAAPDAEHPVDVRTDIWQVGKVIYEMITAESSEKPDGMQPVQAILSRFITEDPTQRPQTLLEVQQLLNELRQETKIRP